jgi:Protein of unknown function (DUF2799)
MKYIILLFLFSSCANYMLKERCEKTNWFNYSQDVAYSGKYLEEDGFIKDCKGVERISAQQIDLGFKLGREKMCTYDEMYRRGKEGQPVYFDFCDALSKSQMKLKYDDGLKIFCTEPNGLVYGKSGAVYLKVCPITSEIPFMNGYRPGRSQYLNLLIVKKKSEIIQLESSYVELIRRETTVNTQYNLIPSGQVCGNREVYNEETKKNMVVTVCQVDSVITSQRNTVIDQLDRIRREMHASRVQKQKLSEEIKAAEHELLVLKQ